MDECTVFMAALEYETPQERVAYLDEACGDDTELRGRVQALLRVREDIWKYYQRLRVYRQSPTPRRKAGLERDFDRLFTRRMTR